MAKLIIIGIAVFFTVGFVLENISGNMKSASDVSALTTADRYIAALREGETIQQNPLTDRPNAAGATDLEECRAENLSPSTTLKTGTVIRVVDGDTLRINVEGYEIPVRLWGIDAPELAQQNGPAARRELEALVPAGTQVKVYSVYEDYYGRKVGVVDRGTERAVNMEMVARGWAYHYRQYDPKNNGCLAEAERTAQDSRMGIWGKGVNGEERPWDRRRRESEA